MAVYLNNKYLLKADFLFLLFKTANEKFVREKQTGQAATEREAMLKDLATAYDIYMELIGNLQEGTKVNVKETRDFYIGEKLKVIFFSLFSISFLSVLQ